MQFVGLAGRPGHLPSERSWRWSRFGVGSGGFENLPNRHCLTRPHRAKLGAHKDRWTAGDARERCRCQVRLIIWCKVCQHQVEPDPCRDCCSIPCGPFRLDRRERLVSTPGIKAPCTISGVAKAASPGNRDA